MRSSLGHHGNSREPEVSCRNLIKTLRFPLQRELKPDSPALNQEQSCAPHLKSNGDWTSLGQHETLPEFSVVTREKPQISPRNSRKTTRLPHHREMKPFFLGGPREQSQVPSENSIGVFTHLRPLKGLQEIPVATREQSRVLCFNSDEA